MLPGIVNVEAAPDFYDSREGEIVPRMRAMLFPTIGSWRSRGDGQSRSAIRPSWTRTAGDVHHCQKCEDSNCPHQQGDLRPAVDKPEKAGAALQTPKGLQRECPGDSIPEAIAERGASVGPSAPRADVLCPHCSSLSSHLVAEIAQGRKSLSR